MALTNAQKGAIAALVIRGAADALAAFCDERENSPEGVDLLGVDDDEIYEQVGKWLHKLPGSFWDQRLPHPEN